MILSNILSQFFCSYTIPRHNQWNVETFFYYISISVNSWFVLINMMNTGQIVAPLGEVLDQYLGVGEPLRVWNPDPV